MQYPAGPKQRAHAKIAFHHSLVSNVQTYGILLSATLVNEEGEGIWYLLLLAQTTFINYM